MDELQELEKLSVLTAGLPLDQQERLALLMAMRRSGIPFEERNAYLAELERLREEQDMLSPMEMNPVIADLEKARLEGRRIQSGCDKKIRELAEECNRLRKGVNPLQ